MLKAINFNPSDIIYQELLIFSALWNLDQTTAYLLKLKVNPNVFVTLTLEIVLTDHLEGQTKYHKCKRSMTPLMAAAANASSVTLNILLSEGADVNAKDNQGNTALIYLCREEDTVLKHCINRQLINGSKENCLDSLLSYEAKLNVKGSEGMTALMHCARNGNGKFIYMLSEMVVNAKVQCDEGRTALMYASFYCADFNGLDLSILIKESDINATDNNGDTALLYSIRLKNIIVFKVLLQNNPDVNIQNKQTYTALMLAAMSDNNIFLSRLLDLKPKLNEKDQEGNTPLIMASMNKSDKDNKCAKLLIAANGIDLNAQNNKGETALMKAIQKRSLDLVESLTATGMNVNLKDLNGNTAIKLARHMCNPDEIMQSIIRHLIHIGADE